MRRLDLIKRALDQFGNRGPSDSSLGEVSGRNTTKIAQFKMYFLGTFVGLVAAVYLTRPALSNLPAPQDPLPQFEALRILIDNQASVVRKIEERISNPGSPPLEMTVRTFHIHQPRPDAFSTFEVGYSVGGEEVARWTVNAAEKTVVAANLPAVEDGAWEWGMSGLAINLLLLDNSRELPPRNAQEPVQVISSDRAREAAEKIFRIIKFVGMTRAEVIWAIGYPNPIEDAPRKAQEGPDDPMIYRFTGAKSFDEYRLGMKDGRVVDLQQKKNSPLTHK